MKGEEYGGKEVDGEGSRCGRCDRLRGVSWGFEVWPLGVHTDVVVSVGCTGGGGEMRYRFGSSGCGGTSNETRLARGGLFEG